MINLIFIGCKAVVQFIEMNKLIADMPILPAHKMQWVAPLAIILSTLSNVNPKYIKCMPNVPKVRQSSCTFEPYGEICSFIYSTITYK